MCDDFIHQGLVEDPAVTRRAFGLLVAGAAAMASSAGAMVRDGVTETNVTVKTADGDCDAALFCPTGKGRWPAVLIWPDIMGLRPVFRDIGSRLAHQGYVVLIPNPFYRSKRAPVMEGPIDFNNPDQRKVLIGYRTAMTDDGIDRDAEAFIAFLDARPQTDKAHKAGVQGYCMGGELSFRTAAAVPARVGAVGSFHGGNALVTDKPDSPHLLIPTTRAAFLVCQAQNDDAQKPELKNTLKSAFSATGKSATVEVYPANHGWCVPGGQAYDQSQAERAWAGLTNLYRTSLA